jgi:hypothetical protein
MKSIHGNTPHSNADGVNQLNQGVNQMKNLIAKCLDKRSNDSVVEHLVSAEIGGLPYVLNIYATDPQDAINKAMRISVTSWRLASFQQVLDKHTEARA